MTRSRDIPLRRVPFSLLAATNAHTPPRVRRLRPHQRRSRLITLALAPQTLTSPCSHTTHTHHTTPPTRTTPAHVHPHPKGLPVKKCDGSPFRIGIIKARWNDTIIDALVGGCTDELRSLGVLDENVTVLEVPGSYEVVFGAQSLLRKGKLEGKPYDAVVCVGCLIKGHTMHFEYICEAVTQVSGGARWWRW